MQGAAARSRPRGLARGADGDTMMITISASPRQPRCTASRLRHQDRVARRLTVTKRRGQSAAGSDLPPKTLASGDNIKANGDQMSSAMRAGCCFHLAACVIRRSGGKPHGPTRATRHHDRPDGKQIDLSYDHQQHHGRRSPEVIKPTPSPRNRALRHDDFERGMKRRLEGFELGAWKGSCAERDADDIVRIAKTLQKRCATRI